MLYFWKFLYWLMMRVGIYFQWSRFYRYLNRDHEYIDTKVVRRFSPTEVRKAIRTLKWVKDGPTELWDAIADPRYGEWMYQTKLETGEQPEGAFDCDDFATWAAASLESDEWETCILNLVWTVKGSIGIEGHNVALVRNRHSGVYWHIGNWGSFGPFANTKAVVYSMWLIRDGAEGRPRPDKIVGFSTFDHNTLKLRKIIDG